MTRMTMMTLMTMMTITKEEPLLFRVGEANKKEQVREEPEDMEEMVEFPNQEEEEEDIVSEESDLDFVPPTVEDDQGQKAATASAPPLIPTKKKQRKPSIVNLHTNGLDPPKFNLLHKAQQPVSADAPGFCEAMDVFVVPPQLMCLCQNCLAKPKDSFFVSASVHIQVISHVCGLTTKDMLKMRGWVFLKNEWLGGSPCRCQSFSDSVYKTTKLGGKNPNNPCCLVCRFDEVLRKMRLEHADLTSNFPSPLVVACRKTSEKKGKEGEPLTKCLCGGLDDEDDEDDDNKGRAYAVPSWELVARSWSVKKANKKEQVSEELEDMEEAVEFPNQEEEDIVPEESDPDFVLPTADDDQGQKAATASAPHLIPTKKKQRKYSVVNLDTNGLDPPKFNPLHKAQQPVSADAPGFREAMDVFVVPPQLMSLCQNCLAKPKDSFFISASVHIQVISHACGLTTKDMLKMRGWFFLKKKSLGGSPCHRCQSFSDWGMGFFEE
jgi:hypothetical protein